MPRRPQSLLLRLSISLGVSRTTPILLSHEWSRVERKTLKSTRSHCSAVATLIALTSADRLHLLVIAKDKRLGDSSACSSPPAASAVLIRHLPPSWQSSSMSVKKAQRTMFGRAGGLEGVLDLDCGVCQFEGR